MNQLNAISLFPDVGGKEIREKLKKSLKMSASGFSNSTAKAFLVSDILRDSEVDKLLWMVNDPSEMEEIIRSYSFFGDISISGLNIDVTEIGKDDENKRKMNEAIAKILSPGKHILVAPYPALLQKIPKRERIEKATLHLKKGEKIDSMELFEELIDLGYEVSEDKHLQKGMYLKQGEVLTVFPLNEDLPIRITFDFDTIESITSFEQISAKDVQNFSKMAIFPIDLEVEQANFLELVGENCIVIDDDLEIIEDFRVDFNEFSKRTDEQTQFLHFTSFPEDDYENVHEHFISVLRYQNILEFVDNIHERYLAGWKVVYVTKHADEITPVFKEKNINFSTDFSRFDAHDDRFSLQLIDVGKEGVLPHAFQNPQLKVLLCTDKEIASFKTQKKHASTQKVYLDFLTSLKVNDYVVHADHGIARFGGIDKKTIDEITREYLKLHYAENDKLFVPIDQADKISKYIGAGDHIPKLTRLGSTEWNTITKKVKSETQQIAKELLALYAQREMAKGFKYKDDDPLQDEFEETFPYEETPGQIKAIIDVKNDMENPKPMDRLVCGDVGFGKTEVAMRASFKAFRNGKQVAVVSPITILADQHYRSFKKRMDQFHVRVEMLSRFKSPKEQKEIIAKLEKGEVDVIIGTHRLLQKDIKFKNLGLVIVDEEQRFGVKQKEKLKSLRAEVDILTLTATPIPRTLNISLNKLRDITTITTPPPGRLPVITEVRKFSLDLIRDAVNKEIERGGQAYILHNRVQTIEGFAERLRALCPNVRFVVGHGKLSPHELEKRIIAFKNGEFDVLVSSTIIENGIDLANANTLIVDSAEKFGLAQLYQLRGRVGRGKRQAYAYFLYHSQRLKVDAKKRLRAIVEASELGSGFQIAMKDLEIRGAGDILGANQHGVINVVGVSQFIRMLNKAVDELKDGKVIQDGEEKVQDVSIELPLSAYIPDSYIVHSKDKINAYQRLSGADNFDYLEELREDLVEEYGAMPMEVINLFNVLELKIYAKQANLFNVKAENIHDADRRQIVLSMTKNVKPENIFKLLEHNSKWIISGSKLKIKTKDLGVQWFPELVASVKKLITPKKAQKKN